MVLTVLNLQYLILDGSENMDPFKSEQRENPREGSENENKQKMPKRKTKIKMGTTGYSY